MDSLLSTVQMPAGTPVATVAIGQGGVRNAAFMAARILALQDEQLEKRLEKHKDDTRKKVLSKEITL
jgi:phosphoribosylaminoimidazole carboxylase PurE protein